MNSPSSTLVALDAMGGDSAPDEIIAGAHLAVETYGSNVVLVGDKSKLGSADGLDIIHASEVIEMGAEPAAAVRSLKDSSIVVGAKAVAAGDASAFVSAGNTGAMMAASLLKMGRIRGVSRPAIAVPFPGVNSSRTTLLDVGANADAQPEWLVQFAQMGTSYVRHRWQIDTPRVGILTIGEEEGKGNSLVKASCELFESFDWASIGAKFVGNLEGRDLLTGSADVVVCDGFTGNIVLKSLEGVYDMFRSGIGHIVGENAEIDDYFDHFDPVNVGTGMLLGVKGVSMIAHGSSTKLAIANALKTAAELANLGMVEKLRNELQGG